MLTRRNLILAVLVLAVIGTPVVWWLASPLFIDQTVDEAFPFALPSATDMEEMTGAEAAAAVDDAMKMVDTTFVESLSEEQATDLQDRLMKLAAMMPDHEMADTMPETTDEWTVAAQGMFQDADDFHKGSGTATVYQQGEQRVLRFEEFSATNGPALHVLLVENIEGKNHDAIGAFVDLGPLKGNMGNQNYELPTDLDLSRYSGVMIYCMPFHVVFATAAFGG